MGIMLTVAILFALLVALVLTVDAMAMAWIEGGQPDPFQGLGQEPPAQRRS
ncbi:MAG TPA: hypothetical protein VF317_03960 [Dermatophilaceae bacterium]|jgi:hypothetical protein